MPLQKSCIHAFWMMAWWVESFPAKPFVAALVAYSSSYENLERALGSVCTMNPHPVALPLLLNRAAYALTVIGHSSRNKRERKAHKVVGHTSCSYFTPDAAEPRTRFNLSPRHEYSRQDLVGLNTRAFLFWSSSYLSFLTFFQCSTVGLRAQHIPYMMHFFHSLISLFVFLALSTSQETFSSLKLPLQRRNVGVSAVQSSGFEWIANVTIGGQNVMLELDTGSSFL